MPLFYHPPPVLVKPSGNEGGIPTKPKFFYFPPVMVDPSPDAMIPAGAPIAALPFGAPSSTAPPPPGWAPGGFWSQTGNFPIACDACIDANSDCPVLRIGSVSDAPNPPAASIAIVPAQKEECLTVTNSESILLDPGQSLTIIAVPCPNCGYAVGKELVNKAVCPACRERKERDDFVARIRNEILEDLTAKARAEINEKEAHEAKLREEAARVGEQFLQEAKRKEAEAAAEANRKAAEEVNRKAAEEVRRKAAEDAFVQEQAAQIRADWEASLRDARCREAKQKAEAYMRDQYRIQEEAELARYKAEMDRQAEIARKAKEAEDLRKRAEFEEAARRKVEAERSRLGAIAELQAQAELRQARLAEETRRHEEFVKSHQEELARLEADKAKLAEELATLGNFNKDDEYAKIKEEVMKEVNAHGNPMDMDELLKRLNELKTDSTPHD